MPLFRKKSTAHGESGPIHPRDIGDGGWAVAGDYEVQVVAQQDPQWEVYAALTR